MEFFHLLIQLKFIAILRDPISRMISQYHFNDHNHVRNKRTFEETVNAEMDSIETCEQINRDSTDEELWLRCHPNRLTFLVARSM